MSRSREDFLTFARVYNDLANYPSLADVAHAIGVAYQTVKNRTAEYRKLQSLDKTLPALISRSPFTRPVVPLSERAEKFQNWSVEECIEELRRIHLENPDSDITRNHFRVHSRISDAVWTQHFGTFEEFKRQAGLMLTRQQHQLEKNIAKHVSVDHYRSLSDARRDWGCRYERPSKSRFKTLLVASDLHDKDIDSFFLDVFLDTARRAQPDVVILAGDVFDLPEFSRYTVDPRDWDAVGRIVFAHEQIFKPLREACPETQIDLIEGNHEYRLLKHLGDATPALKAVLSDLHGLTLEKLFGLDRFEINYVAKGDLAAWTKRDQTRELDKNYKIYFDCFLAHHFPHAREMGLPGVNGHHHRHQVWPGYSPILGAYEWHQLGCGHKRDADYTEGEKWHNGFALAHLDTMTRSVVIDYVPITDFAVVGGRWYRREDVSTL
jgi:hypothetical protein